jgi:AAA+ ATPase superfamily predicted ATPase
MSNFQRNSELEQIQQVLSSSKAEFLYVRGRRRIGKSWLLSDLQARWPDCFLFTGDADSSSRQTINKMAEQWSAFSKSVTGHPASSYE